MKRHIAMSLAVVVMLALCSAAVAGDRPQTHADEVKSLQTQVHRLQKSAQKQKGRAQALNRKVQRLQRQMRVDHHRLERRNQRIAQLRKQLAAMSGQPAPAGSGAP